MKENNKFSIQPKKFKFDQGAKSLHKWHIWLLVGLGSTVAVIILSMLVVWGWYEYSLNPRDASDKTLYTIKIEPGMGANDIANLLEEKSIIRSSTAFNWYLTRSGSRNTLKAGTYRFSPEMSSEEIAKMLANGETATIRVTFIPGYRLDQNIDAMVEAGFKRTDVESALKQDYDYPVLADKPKNASLEGYLYPETFIVDFDSSPQLVIDKALGHFNQLVTDDIKRKLKKQGLTLHEGMILASIVYKEGGTEVDQRKIAQVFLTRLDRDMKLEADPTFKYAAALSGEDPSPRIDSPYNTRLYEGLPPGPIGNFQISALEAVANPAKTDFLYFVAGDNGNVYFSKTLEQHEENTDKYCKELCEL